MGPRSARRETICFNQQRYTSPPSTRPILTQAHPRQTTCQYRRSIASSPPTRLQPPPPTIIRVWWREELWLLFGCVRSDAFPRNHSYLLYTTNIPFIHHPNLVHGYALFFLFKVVFTVKHFIFILLSPISFIDTILDRLQPTNIHLPIPTYRILVEGTIHHFERGHK